MIKKLMWMFHAMFVTHYGEFNWLSITSIVAIFTLIGSMIYNQRKLKADLISKARIEWMNQVRPLFAEYLAAIPKYMFLYNKSFVDGDEESREQLTGKMDEIKKLYYELNLYIPDNKSNELLLKDLNLLWGELDYIGSYYDYGIRKGLFASKFNGYRESNYDKVIDEYISNLINRCSQNASHYFKIEWEKAKEGK